MMILSCQPLCYPSIMQKNIHKCLSAWRVNVEMKILSDLNFLSAPIKKKIFFNPFEPEFRIVISSTTSRELLPQFSTYSGWRWLKVGEKNKENYYVLVNQFHGNFHSKTFSCRKIKCVFRDVKWCFKASWELKGLRVDVEIKILCDLNCLSAPI